MGARSRCQAGQSTVEYAALILLVGVLLAALPLGAAGRPVLETVVGRLLCVLRSGAACGAEALERGFAADVAAALRAHAPEIRFEDGDFASLPVDPRRCRQRRCADTSERGRLAASFEGERPTAFVHAIDCRPGQRPDRPDDADCEGERKGYLYLQYWLYYPDSLTRPFGRLGGYHRDDWESLQLRLGPGGEVDARASSHRGHQYGPDRLSDLDAEVLGGKLGHDPWGPFRGYVWVSAGSHAGRASGGDRFFRSVPGSKLDLLSLAAGLEGLDRIDYAVTPPWRKRVWLDPEHAGT